MKGQVQFGESIMVVIVLVFILIIGMTFYFSISSRGISDEFQDREDIDAITLAKNALNLPEVSCGRLTAKGDCIDLAKLHALGTMLDESGADADLTAINYYRQLFGYATITVHPITSGGSVVSGMRFPLYDNTPDFERMARSQQYLFTTVYDPLTDTVDLAYLNVTRYTQVFS